MKSQKIAQHCRDYLRMIKFYRVDYVPHESTTANNFDRYRDVERIGKYGSGFLTPSGDGRRVILLHIGNDNGFVESCMKCFIGKKGSADYNDEMNAKHFEE